MKLIHSEYKQRNIKIWNEVAPRYHKRWASVSLGPFQSTSKLIELVNITKGDTVLDIACVTGVVSKKIKRIIIRYHNSKRYWFIKIYKKSSK